MQEKEYKIENVAITNIYRSTENKDGEPFISKKGNKFKKVDIYIDAREIDDPDFQGKMSYFDYYGNTDTWEQGTSISGIIKKNGRWFNYELPPKKATTPVATDLKNALSDIEMLKGAVAKLNEKVFSDVEKAVEFSKEASKPVEDDSDLDELPF